jgi:hypothetical protein
MSDELLRNEELLDVEAHMKGTDEPEEQEENEVEGHLLLEQNLLNENLLDESL